MISIPYYNSPTYAMFTQERWDKIRSHPVHSCDVEKCSLCSYARMIKNTKSDVPLPPIGSSKEAMDRFVQGAMEMAQAKRLKGLTIGECIKQVLENEKTDVVDYYGVSSLNDKQLK